MFPSSQAFPSIDSPPVSVTLLAKKWVGIEWVLEWVVSGWWVAAWVGGWWVDAWVGGWWVGAWVGWGWVGAWVDGGWVGEWEVGGWWVGGYEVEWKVGTSQMKCEGEEVVEDANQSTSFIEALNTFEYNYKYYCTNQNKSGRILNKWGRDWLHL